MDEIERDVEFESLRRMVAVSARINGDQDLAETLQAVTDGVVYAVGFGAAVIHHRRSDGMFVCAAATGPPGVQETMVGVVGAARWVELGEPWGELRYLSGESAARGLADGTIGATWIPDVEPSDDPDAWHSDDFLYAPIHSPDGTLIGVLSVDLPPEQKRPSHLLCEMLELFAVQAGIAIANANLREELRLEHEKLEHHATRDWLTGLYNRRVFIERVAAAIQVSRECGGQSMLLFCDLNDFKQLNDTYGHNTGDKVLQEIAQRLQSHVRPGDCVARIGGDEFVILAVDTDDTLIERIRATIAAPLQSCPTRVTASIGQVGVLGTEDPEAVLSLADIAMYTEKQLR